MNRRHFLTISVAGVLLTIVLDLPSTGLRADEKVPFAGNPEGLKVAAEAHRANLTKLKTWRGTVTVSLEYVNLVDGEQTTSRSLSRVKFAVDREKGRTLFDWTQESGSRETAAEIIETTNLQRGGGLVDLESGRFHKVIHMRRPDSSIRRIVAVKVADAYRGRMDYEDFDPLYFFTARGVDISRQYVNFHKSGKPPNALSCSVLTDASTVRVEERFPRLTCRDTVDLTRGGCVIESYYLENARQRLEIVWRSSYELKENVWLPKTLTIDATQPMKGRTRREMYAFENEQVNSPLPESCFSLEELGVEAGDKIKNELTGVDSIFGEP